MFRFAASKLFSAAGARVAPTATAATATTTTGVAGGGAAAPTNFQKFAKTWLSDPSTYPILGLMGMAGCLYVTMGVHELKHPEAKWTRESRHTGAAPDAEGTSEWTDHGARRYAHSRRLNDDGTRRTDGRPQGRADTSILGGLNRGIAKITGHDNS